jgi:hypothetical protein
MTDNMLLAAIFLIGPVIPWTIMVLAVTRKLRMLEDPAD